MAKETSNVQPKLRNFRWGDSLSLPRLAKIIITSAPITKYWKCWPSQFFDCRSGERSWSCNRKCWVHNYPIYEHRWRFYHKKGKGSVAISIENGGRGHEPQMQEMYLEKLEKARKQISPRVSLKTVALLKRWFCPSEAHLRLLLPIPKCKRINLCCFKW